MLGLEMAVVELCFQPSQRLPAAPGFCTVVVNVHNNDNESDPYGRTSVLRMIFAVNCGPTPNGRTPNILHP